MSHGDRLLCDQLVQIDRMQRNDWIPRNKATAKSILEHCLSARCSAYLAALKLGHVFRGCEKDVAEASEQ